MSASPPNHRRRHRQLHRPIGACCALATVGLLNTSATKATPFTITAPIRVPLYWTPISSDYSTTP